MNKISQQSLVTGYYRLMGDVYMCGLTSQISFISRLIFKRISLLMLKQLLCYQANTKISSDELSIL